MRGVVAAGAGECIDRDVEALEVMGTIQGGDERGNQRRVRDAERRAKLAAITGAKQLNIDSVRHLDQLVGPTLRGAAEVGDRVGVVGGEDAHAVRGADEGRPDGALVGAEKEAPRPPGHEPVLVVDEKSLAA
jgi:hypothetical protein